MSREITYAQAINEALHSSLQEDPSVFIVGEGVPDPKGIFGTTTNLVQKFGHDRVMDMPVSENALTGVCIGAALRGLRPVMTHQRVDFALLSLDQIINNAAKWHYMFGGQSSVPLVIRMIIGRGWGQGAQHSQSLQALFAHIPGLKVIMPATPYDVKGLLIAAIRDNNPVICLEHRWLYSFKGIVPPESYGVPLGKAKIVHSGKALTIVASSLMVIEALRAAQILKDLKIDIEVVDVRTIKPLDEKTIVQSVKKTGLLIVADTGWLTGGIAGEIVARVTEKCFADLKSPPVRIALPDIPVPSSPGLTKNFYPDYTTMVEHVLTILKKDAKTIRAVLKKIKDHSKPHDVPDLSFTGPF